MKELADLLRDMEDYIAWIKLSDARPPEENIRRLLTGVLDYDPADEIVPVEAVSSPPAPADPDVKFITVSGQPPVTDDKLECAGRVTLGYGSNLFIYTACADIKVVSVEIEGGELELDVMMEFNLTQDDPTDIATTLWPLCKKDCGKKVLAVTINNSLP